MMDETTKKPLILTGIITLAVSFISLLKGGYSWASGILIGSAWMSLNLLLLNNLFRVAFLKEPKKKLALLLSIKFPLLYTLLFLVLLSKKFPTASILAGMPLVFISQGIIRICKKGT